MRDDKFDGVKFKWKFRPCVETVITKKFSERLKTSGANFYYLSYTSKVKLRDQVLHSKR